MGRQDEFGTLERDKVVAPADMLSADEDLRHGRAPVRPLDHLPPRLSAEIDRNLLILDPLAVEQVLRPPAIWAEGFAVDFDERHEPSFHADT